MRKLLELLVDAPKSSPWPGGSPRPHGLAAVAALGGMRWRVAAWAACTATMPAPWLHTAPRCGWMDLHVRYFDLCSAWWLASALALYM